MDFRFANAKDAFACNDFFNLYQEKTRTIVQWRWTFCPSMFEQSIVPFVIAEDEGRIVGTQAMIPIPMIDRQGVFWTAKSEETLVDPSYRGRRIFEQMYQLLFDYAKQNSIHAIWGFTPAEKAFKRAGFAVPKTTAQLFRPFSAKRVTTLIQDIYGHKQKWIPYNLKRIGFYLASNGIRMVSSTRCALQTMIDNRVPIKKFHLKTLTKPPEDADRLAISFVREWDGATIYRSADYLRWRIFDNPYMRGIIRAAYINEELLGWVIYALDEDSMGYIVDLIACAQNSGDVASETVIKALLADAIKRLQKMGAGGVRAWHINDHPFDRLVASIMIRMGFFHSKTGHAIIVFPQVNVIERSSLKSFDNWFISRLYTEGVLG